ncbi:MAG: DUF1080 domain-containing protein [Proteiniphilum sp.]|nr:DUF1080 domain-containing protein [Proteiniphilum sp.]
MKHLKVFNRTVIITLLFLVVIILIVLSQIVKTTPERKSLPPDNEGFIPIFDGETLHDWEGDSTYWRVENGSLVGEITPSTILDRNTFIIWRGGTPGDFELKLAFRISENGNSGINYRSEPVEGIPFALRGYQCDIDGQNLYTGQNYEERKRTTLAYRGQIVTVQPPADAESADLLQSNIAHNAWKNVQVTGSLGNPDSLSTHIRNGDWNDCHIVVRGNRMQHYINNILMSDVTDNDTLHQSFSGLIGVQVHVGPPMKVEYRNIRIKEFK